MRIATLMDGLRPPVRAMVFLHWIFSFVGTLTGVFVHIYLFQRFGSVSFNALAQAGFFVGCVIGFSGVGVLFSFWRLNMKNGYGAAIIVFGMSFFLLLGNVGEYRAFVFMLVNGFGFGLYWLTLHTFELTETQDEERDRYSSILSAGDQVINVAGPALATALFFISGDLLEWGSYTLLFVIAPLTCLLGFLFLGAIRAYRPLPIKVADVVHFLTEKKNVVAQVYFLSSSGNFAFTRVAIPIAALIFFGDEKHVGLWNTLFAIISIVAVLFLARVRHSGNRVRFLTITSLAGASIALFVAARYDLFAFLVFSLLSIVIKPLERISAHVIDLATMETLGRKGCDFFATMVLRDVALGFWRIVLLLSFAWFVGVAGEGETAVRVGFLCIALSTVLQCVGGRMVYHSKV
ncbi:MAG TPA: MFS transporter [Candidatus Paceibacterota bacterium]